MSEKIAHTLGNLLADSYTLYLKTQNFHWNVKGPRFRDLHLLFQEQYTELTLAVDTIAERIRTLGYVAPGSYSAFAKLAAVKEAPNTPPSAEQMLAMLSQDHKTVVATAKKLFSAAQKDGDEVSADLALQRISLHEKTGWMLESLQDSSTDNLLKDVG